MEHQSDRYKKSWLISRRISRELACGSPGSRLTTIAEFAERFGSSRGIVQKAIDDLQAKGGIVLEKRGKLGTCIVSLRKEVLLSEGGIDHITATMPTPLTYELISLASGVCNSMESCPVPFNFAFVQSSRRRIAALARGQYDFAITSLATANRIRAEFPDCTVATVLTGCLYSPPFVLCGNGTGTISSGDRIAADPNASDQYYLTKRLCRGKKVKIIERPFMSCRAMLLAGEIDFLVYRHEKWIWDSGIKVAPIDGGGSGDYLTPAILINKTNYNISAILQPYIASLAIASVQSDVLERRREPTVY